MNYGRNALTAYSALLCGAFIMALIWFSPWGIWTSLALILALVIVIGVYMNTRARRQSTRPPSEPNFAYTPPPPVEHREIAVSDVRLPSNHEDYFFLFSATVRWSPNTTGLNESMVNMAALAIDTIVKRAQGIAEKCEPGHASLVQHELAGALGTMQEDPTRCIQAMAESVRLALPDQDQQRLEKLATVRKEKAIWEHERKYEQSRREYLSRDVLRDPGSAVVWWLSKNNDHVEKTVEDIGLLAQLSSAANNSEVPESFQRFLQDPATAQAAGPPSPDLNDSSAFQPHENSKSAADHFEGLLHAMDFAESDPERDLFIERMARLADKHGRNDIASAIKSRFGIPDVQNPDPEGPDPKDPDDLRIPGFETSADNDSMGEAHGG
jgi:hypothetical protein